MIYYKVDIMKQNRFKDSFIIHADRYCLLYFPLKEKIALVDNTLLGNIKNNKLIPEFKEILKTKDIDVIKIETDGNPKGSIPPDLMLLPTSDCNLRCRYCYSSGGETKKYLPWDVAKAAIDFSFNNLMKMKDKKKRFHLGFLGGGEPTLNWEVLIKAVNYARKKAKSEKLSFNAGLVTNGTASEERGLWLANNFDSITLSFDGPAEIQNFNRPLANGRSSYKLVYRSAKLFDKNKVNWGVRSTVTEMFVNKMPETVEFFADNFENLRQIAFEPVCKTGRCIKGTCPSPSQEDFVKYFIEARKIGRKEGITIRYSSANLKKCSLRFCGTSGRIFAVNPDCSITSCNEVDDMKKDFSETFIYGNFNKNTNSFDIDMKKVENLRKRTLVNMHGCENCFAKYQCSGGCPVRSLRATGSIFKPYYGNCYIVREALKEELLYLALNKKESVLNKSKESIIEKEAC